MEVRMDDRIALFTGGSKGLGYSMGLKFAESGAEVALLARNQAEVKDAGGYVNGTSDWYFWPVLLTATSINVDGNLSAAL